MHSKYQLIIFDWDGTLMDSVGRIVSSMQASAVQLGFEVPSFDEAKQIIGLSLPEAIKNLFPACTEKQMKEIIAQYKHQYIEVDKTPSLMFDGALTLLNALKDKNKTLAVATGKARAGLQRVWHTSETAHFFHGSRCADECLSKPAPEMIQSLLSEFNIAPEAALMIGDTSYDLEMAQRAQVDSIGVTYGVHQRNILAKYQPKAIVDSFTELHQLLMQEH